MWSSLDGCAVPELEIGFRETGVGEGGLEGEAGWTPGWTRVRVRKCRSLEGAVSAALCVRFSGNWLAGDCGATITCPGFSGKSLRSVDLSTPVAKQSDSHSALLSNLALFSFFSSILIFNQIVVDFHSVYFFWSFFFTFGQTYIWVLDTISWLNFACSSVFMFFSYYLFYYFFLKLRSPTSHSFVLGYHCRISMSCH